jgi:hypothetical protein
VAAHPIVVLWTTPRSRSTAFERMMIERGAHDVVDEPFSARYYLSTEQRSTRYPRHEPSATATAVAEGLLRRAERGPVFVKEMAYHVLGAPTPLPATDVTHTFLVREPGAALASLARKWPDFTREEAGFDALADLHDRVEAASGPPPVIEADDLLADPPGIVSAWCAAVGIPYLPDALRWEPGMVPQWTRWRDWYGGVAASTGFAAPPAPTRPSPTPPPPEPGSPAMPPRVAELAAELRPIYRRLTRHRLSAG